MALPTHVEALSAAIGLPEAAAENLLRALRPDGLLPPGARRGRGVEWTLLHYAVFFMAGGSPTAVEAPSLVRTFGEFTFLTAPGAGEDGQKPLLGPGTVLDVWVRLIERAGRSMDAQERGAPPMPHLFIFNLDAPKRVEVVWFAGNGARARTEIYAPPHRVPEGSGAITRSVTFNTTALVAAGRVWLDVTERRGGRQPPPTHDNAASPAREAAPSRTTSAQDRENDPEPSSSDYALGAKCAQGSHSRDHGCSPPQSGSYTHGRRPHSITTPRP